MTANSSLGWADQRRKASFRRPWAESHVKRGSEPHSYPGSRNAKCKVREVETCLQQSRQCEKATVDESKETKLSEVKLERLAGPSWRCLGLYLGEKRILQRALSRDMTNNLRYMSTFTFFPICFLKQHGRFLFLLHLQWSKSGGFSYSQKHKAGLARRRTKNKLQCLLSEPQHLIRSGLGCPLHIRQADSTNGACQWQTGSL